jgi:hypothetical protein
MSVARMYWDSGYASWSAYGVAGQPAAVLLDRTGAVAGRWVGELDISQVERALAKLR